jgi:hypothetical protein
MGKNAKISEKDYITLCNNINKQIEAAYKAIKGLHDNYNALLKGDKEGPYWNGALASGFYRDAKANLDNAIKAYDDAVKAWEKLRDRYTAMLRGRLFG